MDNKFNEDDKKKIVEYLNFVAKNAKFKLDTKDVVSYFNLLHFMQTQLLPKVEANTMEVVAVHKDEKPKKGKK